MSGDYVLDASAFVLALIGKTNAADEFRRRLPGMHPHAPHLIDAEVGNVLRRHEHGGRITAEEAWTALRAGSALIEHRYPHGDRWPNSRGRGETPSCSTTRCTWRSPSGSACRSSPPTPD